MNGQVVDNHQDLVNQVEKVLEAEAAMKKESNESDSTSEVEKSPRSSKMADASVAVVSAVLANGGGSHRRPPVSSTSSLKNVEPPSKEKRRSRQRSSSAKGKVLCTRL